MATTTIPTLCDDPAVGKKSIVFVSRETGTLWFAGWLFTIGFAHLVWWKALLALVVWPYFLGTMIR